MTEKEEEFRKRLREGVQGNDSIRPSYNPHQNIPVKDAQRESQFQMRTKI